jgi:plasmid rolling circle replication initiator protein Rep
MPNTAQEPIYLSALSPRDARFDHHRLATDRIKELYRAEGYTGYADRMKQCSPYLDFALIFDDNGFLVPKLQLAHFCKVRLCPICQWRKSMMWQAKALKIIPKVVEENPKSRFIFMTLTVKNCELSELRDTLTWMHNSWRKLVKRKEWAGVDGWVRSVEVTRSADDTAHPHYHALLMVKPSYFGGNYYVSQAQWTKTWQDCLAVPYTPIVDVRAVRPGKREKGGEGVLMSSAICETFKYSVKPSECLVTHQTLKLTNQEWLAGLTSQLFKTRAIATGGVLKQYLKDLENEPEDLIHADEDGLVPVDEESPRLAFGWREDLKRYALAENKF